MRLNDVMGLLTSALHDWNGTLVNPRFARIRNAICWDRFEFQRADPPIVPADVIRMEETRQYSMQFEPDGGILRLYYNFDAAGRVLRQASLGFYRIHHLAAAARYDDLGEDPRSASVAEWLRIDYDPTSARGVLHAPCHLHLANLPSARIPVDTMPNPRQFIEFVAAVFYPDAYRSHRLLEDGEFQNRHTVHGLNQPRVVVVAHSACDTMMHLRVPA